MPTRSIQSPPEKRLKPNQGSINSIQNSNIPTEHNLNTDIMVIGKMQTENQTQEISICVSKQPREKVTYLETPVKSENDKKEYR